MVREGAGALYACVRACVCVRVCGVAFPDTQVLSFPHRYIHPVSKYCGFYFWNLFSYVHFLISTATTQPNYSSLPSPKASLLWSPVCPLCPTYSLCSILQPDGSHESDRLKVLQDLPFAFSIKLQCLASLCASK